MVTDKWCDLLHRWSQRYVSHSLTRLDYLTWQVIPKLSFDCVENNFYILKYNNLVAVKFCSNAATKLIEVDVQKSWHRYCDIHDFTLNVHFAWKSIVNLILELSTLKSGTMQCKWYLCTLLKAGYYWNHIASRWRFRSIEYGIFWTWNKGGTVMIYSTWFIAY